MDISTNPQACGVLSCVPAPTSAPNFGVDVTPVEDFASSTWGGWTLASELDAKTVVADLRWAVQGIIPMDSVVLLYGSAYTGKSTLAVHLATCLVSGSTFFGRVAEALPVFYLALENIQDVQAHVVAFQKVQAPGWTWPRPLALSGRAADLGNETDMKALAADICQMTGGASAALIVDALLDGISDRDVTSNADMAAVMRNAHVLAEAIHGPVIFIHHANRTAEKTVLGASVILTRADVHIRVEESKGGSCWTAEKVKGGTKIPPHAFAFRPVPLGMNAMGQEISSCVIIEQGPVKASVKAKSKGTESARQKESPALATLSTPVARLPRRP